MVYTFNNLIEYLKTCSSNISCIVTLIGGLTIATYIIMSCCLSQSQALKSLQELRRVIGNKDLSALCKDESVNNEQTTLF